MKRDYFIADTHFGSESIIRYENRPFLSIEEMDNVLIERWNSVVSKEDTVYVLGDFSAYSDEEKNKKILAELHGEKILIMGNHDKHKKPEEWRRLGFLECSQWPVLYHDFFILSHEPVYLNRNMPYANFYGHVHGNVTYCDCSVQSACISVERIDYTPIEFSEIISRMKSASCF